MATNSSALIRKPSLIFVFDAEAADDVREQAEGDAASIKAFMIPALLHF